MHGKFVGAEFKYFVHGERSESVLNLLLIHAIKQSLNAVSSFLALEKINQAWLKPVQAKYFLVSAGEIEDFLENIVTIPVEDHVFKGRS